MRRITTPPGKGPDREILAGYEDLLKIMSPSCVVADSQERSGVLRSDIRPLFDARFVGTALTVRLYPGDLVDCLDALSVAQKGNVILVDAAGETETSIWGGLMAGLCQQKGVVGAVVDGAIRDTDKLFEVFSIASRVIVLRDGEFVAGKKVEDVSEDELVAMMVGRQISN